MSRSRLAGLRSRRARRRFQLEPLEDRRLLHGDFDLLVFSKTAAFRHDSIDEGIAAIQALSVEHEFNVTTSEDAAIFNDVDLAPFEAVVFLSTTGDVLNATQQAAFERYVQAGGGYIGVHAAADTEYGWAWYGELVGAYFQSHPPGTTSATVRVLDSVHPSTVELPAEWVRTDEWYNYSSNPRGDVHVLMTLDESSYAGGTMGADHPISWCHEHDGGRSWYTGLGHTSASYSEPNYRQHLLGGIEWAAGAVEGDCGATIESNYEKVVLDSNTNNPMELAVANDGRVFFVERGGDVKVYQPESGATATLGHINVFTGNEDGLLGIALDPNFDGNQWIYVFYSPPGAIARQHVSRFTLVGNQLNLASEEVLLEIPTQRAQCCHSAGSLTFGPDGTLYISTGDNTNPFESDGFAPIDERPGRSPWDAQKSSGNRNDLRGKILRIKPTDDGGYTIPDGNLFPADGSNGRPEVYVMGNRNPFRIAVDSETGWLYWGEVGPDANNPNSNRGPQGYDEFNQARGAGNYGWPLFVGDNQAYREYDFATGVSGPAFNPAAPLNNSPNNTGSQQLPAAQPAWIWYPYGASTQFPELGSGGRTAMGGPTYHFDAELESDRKLPGYYDDTVFIYEWSRNWIKEVKLDDAGNVLAINPFLPSMDLRRPMDMTIGPDGAIYMIEWGTGFGGNNADSQLIRIDYLRNNRPPIAVASSDVGAGPVPLEVHFSSAGSGDGVGGPVTFAWDFTTDGVIDSTEPNPTFTYTVAGNYTATLAVTDLDGNTVLATVPIAAGNSAPVVTLIAPGSGLIYDWGDLISYRVQVYDVEDGNTEDGGIDCGDVVVQLFQGHDTHSHPLEEYTGCIGTIQAPAGHGGNGDDLFLVVEARYTDRGAPGVGSFTARQAAVLQPRRIEAEHFDSAFGVQVEATSDRGGGGENVGFIDNQDYLVLRPMDLTNVDALRFRVASAGPGGTIEVRASQGGPLLATAIVTPTGDWQVFKNVTVPIEPLLGVRSLVLTFRGTEPSLFNLNWIDFLRRDDTRPTAMDDAYVVPNHQDFVVGGLGVLGNDFDGQLDPLRARVVAQPDHGFVELNSDGSFTYTPQNEYLGPASFSYVAEQGAPTTVVPLGSTWRYLDNGSNQGTAWRAKEFDDDAWATGAGQFGYGDGDETTTVGFGPNSGQKYITTYFRHTFQVDDPDKYASLKLRILSDDGAGVFVNGELVGYWNLTEGAPFNGGAGVVIGDSSEEAFIEFTIDPTDLVAGENVLAVEIHQFNGQSTDLSFDLELIGVLQSEVTTVQLDLRVPLIGDTNNDNVVNIVDLNNVRNNFGGEGLGDTDGDSDVDITDLNNVRNHFGAFGPAGLVAATRISGRGTIADERDAFATRDGNSVRDLVFTMRPRKQRELRLPPLAGRWDAGLLEWLDEQS
ncbi:MAG: ThuA domain-containing protein [Planctomycetia bacterium]|nr:ThuA domain-containing protein [Planctomycetia bacterium]